MADRVKEYEELGITGKYLESYVECNKTASADHGECTGWETIPFDPVKRLQEMRARALHNVNDSHRENRKEYARDMAAIDFALDRVNELIEIADSHQTTTLFPYRCKKCGAGSYTLEGFCPVCKAW